MILVRSRRLQLNGSNFLWISILLFFLHACSPKVIQRTSVKPGTENDVKKRKEGTQIEEVEGKESKIRTTVERTKVNSKVYKIAILMPFKSKTIQIATASHSDIQSLDLAVDYYQGFMLGLKQNLSTNIRVKIKVLDTDDDIAAIKSYNSNGDLKSDLWVGPVFPSTVKYLINYAENNQALMLSPLSASSPAVFNSNRLISVMPNLAIHADKLVREAIQDFKSLTNVNYVLVKSDDAESVNFSNEIRNYFRKYNSGSQLVEISNVQQILDLKLNGRPYCVFVTTATKTSTVQVLNALGKFKDTNLGAIIKVYGHPNWAKQGYSESISNKLNVHYTAASFHEANDRQVLQFQDLYKKNYILAPSEYAYNGYDVGVFVAKSLNNSGDLGDLTLDPQKLKYRGINSNFDFTYHEKYGYVNLGLRMLEFSNYKLIVK